MAYRYETHLHTCQGSACARSTGAEMARAYKAAGYDAIIVTDHFFGGNTAVPRDLPWAQRVEMYCAGYEDAKAEGEKLGLKVFFGLEWCGCKTEFLTYNLPKEYLLAHPEMEEWDIETYLKNVRAAGAFVSHAHPYRESSFVDGAPLLFPALVDAVEVFNWGHKDPAINLRALEYALEHDLPQTYGSDAHDAKEQRNSGMRFATPINSIEDFIHAVRTRQPFEPLTGDKPSLLP